MILVLRALKLGDLLTAVPALRALARAFPHERRVLAAPAWLSPLVDLSGTGFAVHDTAPLAPLDPALHGAWLAVNLHGRGPESTTVLATTNPQRLVAFDHAGGPAWRDGEHEVARWCRLLATAGIPADPADLGLRPPCAASPPGPAGATVLHPGASTGARCWPVGRWAAVARSERDAGCPVVVTGSGAEVALAEEVARAAGLDRDSVLAGRTGLLELAGVVAGAGRVVSGDTGVAHLATAFATPSVVLFGPVAPAAWGPPGDGPHIPLWAGRTGDPHAEAPDAGLLEITVEDVLGALRRLPCIPGRGEGRNYRRGCGSPHSSP